MARNLVSLAQASEHLRRDTAADDADLQLKITAASRAILNYLGDFATFVDSNGDVPTDSDDVPIVPEEVQAAALMLIGEFYANRAGKQDGEIYQSHGYGFLPRPVVALLYSLRDPVLA